MNTRQTSYVLIVLMAVVVSALVLPPWRMAALPPETNLEPIPVTGLLAPDGRFDGTLIVTAVTVADAGQLLLTGVLHGAAIQCTGAKTQVWRQPFTALAVLVDAEQTTDVVLVKMAPITLASGGRQLTLALVPLDIGAVPDESFLFPMLLN